MIGEGNKVINRNKCDGSRFECESKYHRLDVSDANMIADLKAEDPEELLLRVQAFHPRECRSSGTQSEARYSRLLCEASILVVLFRSCRCPPLAHSDVYVSLLRFCSTSKPGACRSCTSRHRAHISSIGIERVIAPCSPHTPANCRHGRTSFQSCRSQPQRPYLKRYR